MREREAPHPWAQVLRWCHWRYRSPEALGGATASSSWDSLRREDGAFIVWVFDRRGLVGTLEGAHRVLLWHLENIEAMVGHCHELGQGWIPEDGIVRQVDVGDVEVDELGVVVAALSKGDREADLPYRGGGTVSNS